MRSAELAPKAEDQSVAEILSDICMQESEQLKRAMLRMRGKPPMQYGGFSYYWRTLETPLFGAMPGEGNNGPITWGWKVEFSAQMPEAIMWGGKKPKIETPSF